jgi:hypothetical protein
VKESINARRQRQPPLRAEPLRTRRNNDFTVDVESQRPARRMGRSTSGEESPFHSFARKKANKRRKLVLWPGFDSYTASLVSGVQERVTNGHFGFVSQRGKRLWAKASMDSGFGVTGHLRLSET